MTGHSDTSFTVSWDRESCLSRNGPRGHYTVKYFVTGATEILTTTNVTLNSRTFTASSLTPATSYTFQVAYTNTIGTGPFVNLIITTLGYDSKFTLNLVILNNVIINLKWLMYKEKKMCMQALMVCIFIRSQNLSIIS